MPMLTEVSRTAHAPLRAQVVQQFFFQHSTGLNEQASVDSLVGHVHALVIGYAIFSHPEICSGDQSRISLLATMFRNLRLQARRQLFGRNAETQAWRSASWAR